MRYGRVVGTGAAMLLATCFSLVGTSTASAVTPNSCPPDEGRVVSHTGTFYKSLGTAAGKHNAAPTTSTLSFSLSLTTARSSAWEAGGGASVSFGIAQVEASTSYTVTKTTSINKTVTDTLSVPGHYNGYAQPTAEFRTYHIYDEETEPNCKGIRITHDYGYFDAITTVPFFAECVVKSGTCTPHE